MNNKLINEQHTLYVTYINKEIKNSSLTTTNIALAAMVTSQARLRLYSKMKKLGDDPIYCDTDSLRYIYRPGGYSIPSGALLGQCEDEYAKGDFGIEVIELVPKIHGHITMKGSSSMKCKDITMTHDNAEEFTMTNVKKLITGEIDKISTTKLMFNKNHKLGTITNSVDTKFIQKKRNTFKRKINSDFSTTAYGADDIINTKKAKLQ